MTDVNDHDELDTELRDLVRAADPAASLAPADPSRVARLLETTMTDTLTDESRTDGTHHRSRLTWLVAAAATVLIGGGVIFAVTQGDPDPAPVTAGDPAPSSQPAQTVTELTSPAGGGIQAKCMAVSSDAGHQVLGGADVAFDGTVTSISGEMVTLEPSTFYAGDETDLVVVRAPDADMAALLSAVTFEEGGRYLVSAVDGVVSLCGFSGEYDDTLASDYAASFGS